MKANRVFHLAVTRGGREPVFMADRRRVDRIEVVSVDDGELLLYWELPAKDEILASQQEKLRFLYEQLAVSGSKAMIERYINVPRRSRPAPLLRPSPRRQRPARLRP